MQWSVSGTSALKSDDNQNGSSLDHYGVLGMRWGVRKEDEKSVQKAYRKVNFDEATRNTKIEKHSDGSITITNLRHISSAEFDNEEVYKKWLANEHNPLAEDKGGYAYFGGELLEDGQATISGVGYKLNFGNEASYTAYVKSSTEAWQNKFIHDALTRHKSEVDSINSAYDSSLSESDLASVYSRIDALEENVAKEAWNEELNGVYEYRKYLIESIDDPGITKAMKEEAIRQLKEELEAMGFDESKVLTKDSDKKTQDALKKVKDKTVKTASKEISKGKEKTEGMLSKIGSFIAETISVVGTAVKNAYNTASNFVKKLFKK